MPVNNIRFRFARARPGAPRELQVSENPAASPFQDGAIDVVPQREQLAFELANEDSKLGIVGTRVHL